MSVFVGAGAEVDSRLERRGGGQQPADALG